MSVCCGSICFIVLFLDAMVKQILDFSENNGLILCNKPARAQNSYERLYLFEVTKLNAYAVFFRRFYKSKEDSLPYKSEPAVCIFLEEQIPIGSKKHHEVHAALWSEGKVDIYIILKGNSRLDIYNVKKPAEKIENQLSLKNLLLASDSITNLDEERFSARLFGQGTFWEQKENKHHIDVNNSPYKHLVEYLMSIRKEFLKNTEYDLRQETVDKLLVLTILIKFLEEKKDTYDDKSTLDEIYSKYSIESIEEIQGGEQLLAVIQDLSNEFNGKIFDQFDSDEQLSIQSTNLSILSDFLKADIELKTGQVFLWRQYSFQHLPAEVISAIYENFIQAEAEIDGRGHEKGVVYTPIHLVNFLIDEAMPLDVPPISFIETGIYKILDPTCGSGVFLVAAYKRLLQWWTILESQKTGKIVYPDVSTAQKILEDNLFGVDVKSTAVRVTIFGLTTALLDFLTPKQVWSKLKFKDLTYRNIVHADPPTGFFKWALDAKNKGLRFSLTIGNPPFNPEKKEKKEKVLDEKIIKSLDLKHKNIPRKNFALHFFETSMLLTDRICMIIPSNVLLYDKSASEYRINLLTNYSVSHIYDFTHLRETLFVKKGGGRKMGRTPVVALFAENKLADTTSVQHIVVKRTISVEQKLRFEIDDYDNHSVKWDWAVDPEKQFVWKTNLLGGGRLFHLIARFKSLKSLADVIQENEEWSEIRGFEGGSKYTIDKCDRIISISENGKAEIDYNTTLETSNLKEGFMYEPPFMIIEQVIGSSNIPVFLASTEKFHEKQKLYYNRDFLGISVPPSGENLLKEIYKSFRRQNENSLNYRLFVTSISSSSLILTETDINKSEILSVPFTQDEDLFRLSDPEKIVQNDVLKYYIHLGKAISPKSDGFVLHRNVKQIELTDYGQVLCSELNDIYAQDNNLWQLGKVFRMASFTVYQVGFGREGGLEHKFIVGGLDKKVEELINNETSNKGARYRRVVRFYDHVDGFDCIYFVKPNPIRYWLKSIALRDADETFVELREEGY